MRERCGLFVLEYGILPESQDRWSDLERCSSTSRTLGAATAQVAKDVHHELYILAFLVCASPFRGGTADQLPSARTGLRYLIESCLRGRRGSLPTNFSCDIRGYCFKHPVACHQDFVLAMSGMDLLG